MLYGIFEDFQPRTGIFLPARSRPGGVLGEADMTLGVRHQTQDQTGAIADSRNIIDAPIGIGPVCVNQGDLPIFPQAVAHRIIGGDELAFAMSHRQFQRFQAGGQSPPTSLSA